MPRPVVVAMAGGTQVRQRLRVAVGGLGLEEISEKTARGGGRGIPRCESERFQARDAVVISEEPFALFDREVPARAMGEGRVDHLREGVVDRDAVGKISRFRKQEFARGVAGDRIGKFRTVAHLHDERPGRQFGDRDRHPVVLARRHRRDEILASRFEEGLVDECARREHAGHRAIDHAFVN